MDKTVFIECCNNCQTHNWCTRHDQNKYRSAYFNVHNKIIQKNPDLRIVLNEIPKNLMPLKKQNTQNKYYDSITKKCIYFPALGAFQVYFNNVIVFSKHESQIWPDADQIALLINKIKQQKQKSGNLNKFSKFIIKGNENQNDENSTDPKPSEIVQNQFPLSLAQFERVSNRKKSKKRLFKNKMFRQNFKDVEEQLSGNKIKNLEDLHFQNQLRAKPLISNKTQQNFNNKSKQSTNQKILIFNNNFDKQTQKNEGSLKKNPNIILSLDQRETFYGNINKPKTNMNFTLTDHFKMYKSQPKKKKLFQGQDRSLQKINNLKNYISEIDHINNLKRQQLQNYHMKMPELIKQSKYKNNQILMKLPQFIKKKKEFFKSEYGQKQMIIRLDNIEEQNLQSVSQKQNTKQIEKKSTRGIMKEWDRELQKLEDRFEKFEQKVQIIKQKKKQFQDGQKFDQNFFSLLKNQVDQKQKNKIDKINDKIDEIEKIYAPYSPISTSKENKIPKKVSTDYFNIGQQEKTSKLKKIYGKRKINAKQKSLHKSRKNNQNGQNEEEKSQYQEQISHKNQNQQIQKTSQRFQKQQKTKLQSNLNQKQKKFNQTTNTFIKTSKPINEVPFRKTVNELKTNLKNKSYQKPKLNYKQNGNKKIENVKQKQIFDVPQNDQANSEYKDDQLQQQDQQQQDLDQLQQEQNQVSNDNQRVECIKFEQDEDQEQKENKQRQNLNPIKQTNITTKRNNKNFQIKSKLSPSLEIRKSITKKNKNQGSQKYETLSNHNNQSKKLLKKSNNSQERLNKIGNTTANLLKTSKSENGFRNIKNEKKIVDMKKEYKNKEIENQNIEQNQQQQQVKQDTLQNQSKKDDQNEIVIQEIDQKKSENKEEYKKKQKNLKNTKNTTAINNKAKENQSIKKLSKQKIILPKQNQKQLKKSIPKQILKSDKPMQEQFNQTKQTFKLNKKHEKKQSQNNTKQIKQINNQNSQQDKKNLKQKNPHRTNNNFFKKQNISQSKSPKKQLLENRDSKEQKSVKNSKNLDLQQKKLKNQKISLNNKKKNNSINKNGGQLIQESNERPDFIQEKDNQMSFDQNEQNQQNQNQIQPVYQQDQSINQQENKLQTQQNTEKKGQKISKKMNKEIKKQSTKNKLPNNQKKEGTSKQQNLKLENNSIEKKTKKQVVSNQNTQQKQKEKSLQKKSQISNQNTQKQKSLQKKQQKIKSQHQQKLKTANLKQKKKQIVKQNKSAIKNKSKSKNIENLQQLKTSINSPQQKIPLQNQQQQCKQEQQDLNQQQQQMEQNLKQQIINNYSNEIQENEQSIHSDLSKTKNVEQKKTNIVNQFHKNQTQSLQKQQKVSNNKVSTAKQKQKKKQVNKEKQNQQIEKKSKLSQRQKTIQKKVIQKKMQRKIEKQEKKLEKSPKQGKGGNKLQKQSQIKKEKQTASITKKKKSGKQDIKQKSGREDLVKNLKQSKQSLSKQIKNEKILHQKNQSNNNKKQTSNNKSQNQKPQNNKSQIDNINLDININLTNKKQQNVGQKQSDNQYYLSQHDDDNSSIQQIQNKQQIQDNNQLLQNPKKQQDMKQGSIQASLNKQQIKVKPDLTQISHAKQDLDTIANNNELDRQKSNRNIQQQTIEHSQQNYLDQQFQSIQQEQKNLQKVIIVENKQQNSNEKQVKNQSNIQLLDKQKKLISVPQKKNLQQTQQKQQKQYDSIQKKAQNHNFDEGLKKVQGTQLNKQTINHQNIQQQNNQTPQNQSKVQQNDLKSQLKDQQLKKQKQNKDNPSPNKIQKSQNDEKDLNVIVIEVNHEQSHLQKDDLKQKNVQQKVDTVANTQNQKQEIKQKQQSKQVISSLKNEEPKINKQKQNDGENISKLARGKQSNNQNPNIKSRSIYQQKQTNEIGIQKYDQVDFSMQTYDNQIKSMVNNNVGYEVEDKIDKKKKNQQFDQEIDLNQEYRANIIKNIYYQDNSEILKYKQYVRKFQNQILFQDSKFLKETNFKQVIDTIKWQRLSKIFLNPSLYNTPIQISQISYQNKYSENIHTVLKILLQKNQFLLTRLFQETKLNKNGLCGLWLCLNSAWSSIIIDDFIPINNKSQLPIFMSSKRKNESNLWFILLQKAIAKAVNGYNNLQVLTVCEIFQMLTGCNYLNFKIKQDPSQNMKFLKYLKQNEKKNFIIHAQRHKKYFNQENIKKISQIYYIIGIQNFGSDKDILLQIRSDNEEPFWMKYQIFCEQFKQVNVLQLRQNYLYTHQPISLSSMTFTIVQIIVKNTTFGSISISHKQQVENYKKTKIILYRQQDKNILRLVGQAQQKNKKYMFFQCQLLKGKYYLFLQAQKQNSNINLSYSGQEKISFKIVEKIQNQTLKNKNNEYIPLNHKENNKLNSKQFIMPKTITNVFEATEQRPQSTVSKTKKQYNIDKIRSQFFQFLLKSQK